MRLIVTALCVLFTGHAAAQSCETVVEGNDMLQFNVSEITVPADCDSFSITLKHVGALPVESMGHNVVISETSEFQALATASIAAGLENNYVVQGDDRVLAASDMIGGGEETTLVVDVSGWDRAGDYTFFCTFPGHVAIMNGKFILES
ncbi:MAG: azurin [Pseudomonadota bacterium]